MAKIEKHYIKEFNKHRTSNKFLCNAPFSSMKISIDGKVSPCCYNLDMIDLYPHRSLEDIWNGDIYSSYRSLIKKNILPYACYICEKFIRNKEYNSVKINQYDYLKVSKIFKNKPRLIEVALSNTCNLECIMCCGVHSSSIRRNVEKREEAISIFGDDFRIELRKFIPNLQEMVFAGGEPFLIPLYYKIWDDIIAINPNCKISLVTNGTVLNDKIKEILQKGNFKINLSLDAITKTTYEKIRVNANFEKVMQNVEYFGNILKDKNARLHIPICPLKINRFELPDLVEWCNEKEYSINFVKVNRAVDVAMYDLNSEELKELKAFYNSYKFKSNTDISKSNILEFRDLISRLNTWIDTAFKKEHFRDLYDLKTDKVEEYRELFVNNLKAYMLKYNKSEVKNNDYHLKYMKCFDEILDEMPDYFRTNHFYKKLLHISPFNSINIFDNYVKPDIKNIFRDLFFYM